MQRLINSLSEEGNLGTTYLLCLPTYPPPPHTKKTLLRKPEKAENILERVLSLPVSGDVTREGPQLWVRAA